MRPVLPARCSAPTAMNAPPEARSGAARSAMIALRLSSSSAHEFVLSRALGLAHSAQRVGDSEDFRRSALPIKPEHRRIEIIVQARVSSGENQQRRGDFGAQRGDRVELLLRRFKSNDLHAFVFRRLSEKLVDLRQIERFAFRFAGRNRSQDGEKPGLQVVGEFSRDSQAAQRISRFPRGPPGAMAPSNVSWSRSSAFASVAAVMLAFSDGIHRPAEFGRHNLGAVDELCGAPGDFERELVGRMNCAEEVRRRKTGLLDAPHEAVAVYKIVRSRRTGCGEPLDLGEIRALTGPGRRGRGKRKREDAEKECAGAQRRSPDHPHSFLNATSSIRWLAPFLSSKSARGRVGRIFSCRLTRLIRRQIERAVASASASSRSAYWRK